MDLFEAIRTRRSIRSFTDEPVSQEDMDRMLEAAMCAPSANNRQLWHFVVIRDREMLRKVAEVHPYAKMAAGAAAAVIIWLCGPATTWWPGAFSRRSRCPARRRTGI